MKFHNGVKRVNKLDGGKKLAKKQYHKGLRQMKSVGKSYRLPVWQQRCTCNAGVMDVLDVVPCYCDGYGE